MDTKRRDEKDLAEHLIRMEFEGQRVKSKKNRCIDDFSDNRSGRKQKKVKDK